MEIKVGRYGRTNLGDIFIFAWLEIDGKRVENKVILGDGQKITNDFYYFAKGERIVKHSKNIIDLIEEGDYVNGYKVFQKEGTLLTTKGDGINRSGYIIPISQYGEDIKSIVTKEQFEQMKYIVGE